MDSTRRYPWLLAGTIIAVIGLLAIQVILIDKAYRAADRAFEQNVNAALQTVAQRLEAREIVTTVLWVGETRTTTGNPGQDPRGPRIMMALPRSATADSVGDTRLSIGITGEAGQPPMVRELHEVNVTRAGTQAAPDRVRLTTVQREVTSAPASGSSCADSVRFYFRFETTADTMLRKVVRGDSVNVDAPHPGDHTRSALVTRVIDRLSGAERKPIQNRTDAAQLDSLLRSELRANGILLDFVFGVMGYGEDTLRIGGSGAAREDVIATPYRTRLFPADILAPRSDLVVSFPGARWYLVGQIGPYALATLLFAAIIVLAALSAFRTIARQQRLSTQVRDFINNMVHEFKTPLSTITLAAEAVVRPDVIGQRARIRRYVHVIGEETGRMRNGVSKILQMAVVEEGDYDLSLVPVDVHALLEKAASAFAVQVESRGGSLTLHQGVVSARVIADHLHLTNIVHNILENAVKYTPGVPEIAIRTGMADGSVTVRITDNGIGMAPEEAGRVFDKYYRVSTGNLHDVKGFGLGLAYVRLMVTAMKGTVGVESEPGQGTTVIVSLPGAREGAA